MKTILAICGLILLGGAIFAWRSMQAPTVFGSFTGAKKTPVEQLVQRPKDYLGKSVVVEGIVQQQCKAMGCFFFIPAEKGLLRVELQAIAMTAPMKEGHQARVEGQMVPFGDGYQLFANAVEFY